MGVNVLALLCHATAGAPDVPHSVVVGATYAGLAATVIVSRRASANAARAAVGGHRPRVRCWCACTSRPAFQTSMRGFHVDVPLTMSPAHRLLHRRAAHLVQGLGTIRGAGLLLRALRAGTVAQAAPHGGQHGAGDRDDLQAAGARLRRAGREAAAASRVAGPPQPPVQRRKLVAEGVDHLISVLAAEGPSSSDDCGRRAHEAAVGAHDVLEGAQHVAEATSDARPVCRATCAWSLSKTPPSRRQRRLPKARRWRRQARAIFCETSLRRRRRARP
jgi:hypothetical protein